MSNETLANLLHEDRSFPPDPAFAAQANGTAELYAAADADYEGFWGDQARRYVTWSKPFTEVLDWSNAPFAKWFADGELNAAYNCVDRHVEEGRGDKVALHWVGEPGDTRDVTYADLHREVQQAANALIDLGLGKGDTVAIYLPMIPEAVVAMLACARIGVPHSVVFGGFSAEALNTRIADAQAKVVITSDGGYRRGTPSALKPAVDAALDHADTSVQKVLVVRRTGQDIAWNDARDLWWHEAMAAANPVHVAQGMEAEHPLFILYTSGTTGKPKGIFHTTGGYLTQAAYTNAVVHDVHPESDVYWCTADIGWVTGHSYIVYGPLALGATQVLYEGTPDTPHQGRFWEIVQQYKVSILYTAPTAIRTFMKWGSDIPAKFDLSSIRMLGSVGEPINPEAWMWYRNVIGGGHAPIVDTWWQTETGGILISSLAGVTDEKPAHAAWPFPGVQPVLLTADGKEILENEQEGLLCMKFPWPGMLRTTWGDHERCRQTYFSSYKGYYFTGDGARRDAEGRYRIIGRVDDVINVSGHRFGTAEIENAINESEYVVESAVVGYPHDIKGQGIYAYVIAEKHIDNVDQARAAILATVTKVIGPIAKPDKIQFVSGLPKTRSGKIMRRILRKVAEGELNSLGDTTTLLDPAVVDEIKAGKL